MKVRNVRQCGERKEDSWVINSKGKRRYLRRYFKDRRCERRPLRGIISREIILMVFQKTFLNEIPLTGHFRESFNIEKAFQGENIF